MDWVTDTALTSKQFAFCKLSKRWWGSTAGFWMLYFCTWKSTEVFCTSKEIGTSKHFILDLVSFIKII